MSERGGKLGEGLGVDGGVRSRTCSDCSEDKERRIAGGLTKLLSALSQVASVGAFASAALPPPLL